MLTFERLLLLPLLLLLLLVLATCSDPASSSLPAILPFPTDASSSLSSEFERVQSLGQIASGVSHTCLLTNNGGVKCWGATALGQPDTDLAGSPENFGKPFNVNGLESDVIAIAVGAYHSCALTEQDEVKCWGQNAFGQLGDGTTEDAGSQVDVQGLPEKVNAIAAGYAHTCALTIS